MILRAVHLLKADAFTFGAAHLGECSRMLEQGELPSDDNGLIELDTIFAESATELQALQNG